MTIPLDYRGAGVDIDAADEAKKRLRALVETTRTAGSLGAFGGFGGLFRAPGGESPVLVASADGLGTKVKVAIESGRHDTVGHDLVNHCVNDILVIGAAPLFFLDYVAFGVLDASVLHQVVAGVAAGCRENRCALLGGETAQMPGLYTPPDYDLAGFVVGSVEEDALLSPDHVREGDALIAFESSGLHTNGYSLARRVVHDRLRLGTADPFPGEGGASVADVLLRVHRSYLAALQPSLGLVHALAHITGGGLPGNVNRALPLSLDAVVDLGSWRVPNVFQALGEAGGIDEREMFRAFNMGVGMVAIAPEDHVPAIVTAAARAGVAAWRAGEVVRGSGSVLLTGGGGL